MEKQFIPFALPDVGEEEIEEVTDTLRSGWLTQGPKVARFEKAFAEFVGAKHALAVNSCTAALHLGLEAIGVGPGDKVITTPYTFTATAEVIRYLGADPVFVDILPDTFNIDPNGIEKAIADNPSAKAIIPVHFGGQACEMDDILDLSEKHGLSILEDAAHAIPSVYKGRMVGSFSTVSAFSFYATKTLTTGEGGMVATDSEEMIRHMEMMRLHGISRNVWDRYNSKKPGWMYEVVAPGFKYNMTDIMAAIGLRQLEKVERFQKRRQEIAEKYTAAFSGLPVELPRNVHPENTHAWHLYVIRLDTDRMKIGRDDFISEMSERGIGASVHFIPLHIHPYWQERYGYQENDFPVAFDCFQRVVSLPIYTRMTDDDVDRVINEVGDLIRSNS